MIGRGTYLDLDAEVKGTCATGSRRDDPRERDKDGEKDRDIEASFFPLCCDATRDRVTWTNLRDTGEVGCTDKEPQEKPIPPCPAIRVLARRRDSSSHFELFKIVKVVN